MLNLAHVVIIHRETETQDDLQLHKSKIIQIKVREL